MESWRWQRRGRVLGHKRARQASSKHNKLRRSTRPRGENTEPTSHACSAAHRARARMWSCRPHVR
eukprot:6203607-Pleurochrysis_carterae.AAC.2